MDDGLAARSEVTDDGGSETVVSNTVVTKPCDFVARPKGREAAETPSGLDGGEAVVWLPRAAAAKALGTSRSAIQHRLDAGKLESRVEKGIRLFKVSAAGLRAIATERRRTKDGEASVAIVKAVVEGLPIDEICTMTGCPPTVVANTLAALKKARALYREMEEEQRAADEKRRAYEIETGNPDLPTNWAWCDMRFQGTTHKVYGDGPMPTFIEVRREYDAWVKANPEAKVPPYVAAAVADQASWLSARKMWLFERTKRAAVVGREQEKLEAESRRRVASVKATELALEVAENKERERRQKLSGRRVAEASKAGAPGYSSKGRRLGRPTKAELRKVVRDAGGGMEEGGGGGGSGVEENDSSCLNEGEDGTSPD